MTRFVPWYPYPDLGVAQLEEPELNPGMQKFYLFLEFLNLTTSSVRSRPLRTVDVPAMLKGRSDNEHRFCLLRNSHRSLWFLFARKMPPAQLELDHLCRLSRKEQLLSQCHYRQLSRSLLWNAKVASSSSSLQQSDKQYSLGLLADRSASGRLPRRNASSKRHH